jgi:potassium/hydrogen antiporter
MTNYIILALCIIVILSYIFDITSKYTRIPGVIFLILLGIGMQVFVKSTGMVMPNIRPILPVVGTLGLIMIVMEASLDIQLKKNKKKLILKSVSSAVILFVVSVIVLTYLFINMTGISVRDAILNAIPLSIISGSVAIPAAFSLSSGDKEFIVYESAFCDILGIMIFDLVLLGQSSVGAWIINLFVDGLITIIIALISTASLAILLHKTRYHVNYVIILTSIIFIYSLAKLFNLPALLLILVFGLVLSNNQMLENEIVKVYVDFRKFREDIGSFKKILGELTFLVKSFFFIIFGFYSKIEGLFYLRNILTGLIITAGIFLLRWLFLKFVFKLPAVPLVFFAPRGLITILLFMSIPLALRSPLMNEELITIVIFFSIIVLMIGNMLHESKKTPQLPSEPVQEQKSIAEGI